MKKLVVFILTGMLLFILVGPVSANVGKITAYVVAPEDNGISVGGDRDEHGCISSARYTWCEKNNKCIHSWEENCTNVKIMPSTASATAIARLGIKNCNESEGCTIVLKETESGNQTKATYEIKAKKEAKLLGLIKTKMEVTVEVDAETGEIISTKRPFWAFLAKEE